MTADNRIRRLPNEYPVELAPPDLAPYKAGTDGVPYVHTFRAAEPGPHVALSALVHGNEPCGAIVLVRFLEAGLRPLRGTLSFVFVNVEAYDLFSPDNPNASRWVERDFNRLWSPKILEGPDRGPDIDRARELRAFFDTVDTLLDLHSMQHRTAPLMLAGAADKGLELALAVGAPELVVRDEGHAAGPRLRDYDGFADPASDKNALLVECGQHWEKASADVALDTAVRFLRFTGVVAPDFMPEAVMPAAPQRVIRVTDRVTINSDDFAFASPFKGMEVVPEAGTVIAHDGGEPVKTPYDNCVLVMPSKRLWRGQTAVRLGRFETH